VTKGHQHPTLSSVRIWLNQGVRTMTWGVTYRTMQGREVFDRRVSAGMFDRTRPLATPQFVVESLEQVCVELRRRYGLPPASGGPGALEGGGGGPDPSHEGLLPPLHVVQDPD